jgi:hypothetical protein
MTFKYKYVFAVLFKEILPNLQAHFDDEMILEELWLLKWL